MKVKTFWWGVRLLADTDEDWDALVKISNAEVVSKYESGEVVLLEGSAGPAHIDYPEDRRFLEIMR